MAGQPLCPVAQLSAPVAAAAVAGAAPSVDAGVAATSSADEVHTETAATSSVAEAESGRTGLAEDTSRVQSKPAIAVEDIRTAWASGGISPWVGNLGNAAAASVVVTVVAAVAVHPVGFHGHHHYQGLAPNHLPSRPPDLQWEP